MYLFLLITGVVMAAIGVGTIAFGAPIYEFSLGNALIITGAMLLTGGLVLIGLAAAVGHLRRIADALTARPSARAAREPTEAMRTAAAREPAPRASPGIFGAEGPPRDLAEPTLAPLPMDTEPKDQFEPLRPDVVTGGRPDMPMAEQPEAMPPKVARRLRRGPPAAAEARFEPKFGPAEILSRLDSKRAAPKDASPAERTQPNLFDKMPPSETRRPAEIIPPDYPVDLDATQREQGATQPPNEPRAVSILKSGVIDGMAYTLFTDGSIEAQLPQGTLRFASIEELRIHLERGD
jgi:hypothetical protein